jgi:hypothetical protein
VTSSLRGTAVLDSVFVGMMFKNINHKERKNFFVSFALLAVKSVFPDI